MTARTLILFFHPEHERSKANRAMTEAASGVAGVEVVNMGALYPDIREIDVAKETERLFDADRLVLQFPIHWYGPPPLLWAWQNSVLTRMFYVHPEDEGARIKGLPLKVATTAGNVPEAYSAAGVNRYPLSDLLHSLEATASRCALRWTEPFIIYRANRLDEGERAALGERYAAMLAGWTDTIPREGSAE